MPPCKRGEEGGSVLEGGIGAMTKRSHVRPRGEWYAPAEQFLTRAGTLVRPYPIIPSYAIMS